MLQVVSQPELITLALLFINLRRFIGSHIGELTLGFAVGGV